MLIVLKCGVWCVCVRLRDYGGRGWLRPVCLGVVYTRGHRGVKEGLAACSLLASRLGFFLPIFFSCLIASTGVRALPGRDIVNAYVNIEISVTISSVLWEPFFCWTGWVFTQKKETQDYKGRKTTLLVLGTKATMFFLGDSPDVLLLFPPRKCLLTLCFFCSGGPIGLILFMRLIPKGLTVSGL